MRDKCQSNSNFWGLFVIILLWHIIALWHTSAEHKATQAYCTDQIAQLKAQVQTLTEALQKHDKALTTHDTRPEWWQREEE